MRPTLTIALAALALTACGGPAFTSGYRVDRSGGAAGASAGGAAGGTGAAAGAGGVGDPGGAGGAGGSGSGGVGAGGSGGVPAGGSGSGGAPPVCGSSCNAAACPPGADYSAALAGAPSCCAPDGCCGVSTASGCSDVKPDCTWHPELWPTKCSPPDQRPIKCGSTTCYLDGKWDPTTHQWSGACYYPNYTCDKPANGGVPITCNAAEAPCDSGICCASTTLVQQKTFVTKISCEASCNPGPGSLPVCDPSDPNACPSGWSCGKPSTFFSPYAICLKVP